MSEWIVSRTTTQSGPRIRERRELGNPTQTMGLQTVMAGNLIQNQFTTARDWPFGSAVSLALMVLSMVLLALWMRDEGSV